MVESRQIDQFSEYKLFDFDIARKLFGQSMPFTFQYEREREEKLKKGKTDNFFDFNEDYEDRVIKMDDDDFDVEDIDKKVEPKKDES